MRDRERTGPPLAPLAPRGAWAALAATLALAGAPAAAASAPPPTAPEPPPLRLDGAEPRVVARIEAARRLVLADPDSDFAWGDLAMSLDVHGFRREAVTCYRRAAELDPGRLRWTYFLAVALAETGDPEALDWFERSRRLSPDYAPLLVRQAEALAGAGRIAAAREAYSAALSAEALAYPARLGLARLALAEGDLAAAADHARQAAAVAPERGEAHGLLAEVFRRLERPADAAREARLAARAGSEPPPLPDPVYAALAAEGVSSFWYRRRGRDYLGHGDGERAEAELRQAVAAAPTAEARNDLGLALQLQGRFAEAAQEHRAALALRPGYADAHQQLGLALAELGEIDAALEALERAAALEPGLRGVHLNLGTLAARAGRRQRAIASLRTAAERDPEDPRAALRLARLLATAPEPELRDGAEAVRLAERFAERPGGPQALDVLAAAYAEAGRFETAATTARRARELALAAGDEALAGAIAARLALYEAGTPFHGETW